MIGVQLQAIDTVFAKALGLPQPWGVIVADVIHAVNRTFVLSLADLRAAVADMKDGDPVVVPVERQGQLMFVAFEMD